MKYISPLLSALILVSVLLGAGCNRPRAEAKPPLKVGGIYWPGAYWTDIADKKGWFKEAGLDVEVINVDADYIGAYDLLLKGELDTMELPFFDHVRLNTEGANLVGVLVGDYSVGAEKLIAKPGIESIKDLKGRKVGLKRNTYTEYIFNYVAERNHLNPNEVEIVDMQAELVTEEYVNGRVDAIFPWEPLLTEAMEKVPGTNTLFSTAEIPGIAGSVQVFDKKFIEERPEDVQIFVNVWARATEFIQTNPDEAFAIIAKIYGRPVEEVREFTEVDQILGLRENELAFSFASGFDSIHGTARQMNDFMMDRGLTSRNLDTNEMVDSRFIRSLGN